MCPYFPQARNLQKYFKTASDENVQGSLHKELSQRNLKQVALFVRLGFLYTNTDVTKTKLSKTFFKPKEFENAAFRFRLDG